MKKKDWLVGEEALRKPSTVSKDVAEPKLVCFKEDSKLGDGLSGGSWGSIEVPGEELLASSGAKAVGLSWVSKKVSLCFSESDTKRECPSEIVVDQRVFRIVFRVKLFSQVYEMMSGKDCR